MRFELFIALRYLLALRGRAFISITAVLSIIGVTLGVGALIIIMAVMTGFTTDLQEKILGVASHVVVKSMNRTNMDSPEVLDVIRSPQVQFTVQPQRTLALGQFLQRVGAIKATPAQLSDYFFDDPRVAGGN